MVKEFGYQQIEQILPGVKVIDKHKFSQSVVMKQIYEQSTQL